MASSGCASPGATAGDVREDLDGSRDGPSLLDFRHMRVLSQRQPWQ